jgi:hypothetical protein
MHRWIHYSSDSGFRNFMTNVRACRHGPLHPSLNCERPLTTGLGHRFLAFLFADHHDAFPFEYRIYIQYAFRYTLSLIIFLRSCLKPSLCDRHKNIPGLRIREEVAYTASGYVRRRARIQAQRSKEQSGEVDVGWRESDRRLNNLCSLEADAVIYRPPRSAIHPGIRCQKTRTIFE